MIISIEKNGDITSGINNAIMEAGKLFYRKYKELITDEILSIDWCYGEFHKPAINHLNERCKYTEVTGKEYELILFLFELCYVEAIWIIDDGRSFDEALENLPDLDKVDYIEKYGVFLIRH